MYALGQYCYKFGNEDRTQETIIFMDEAWFFNTTAVGRSIIKRVKRLGRSENSFLVLITQSVDDTVNEDDNTGFGTIFAFHSSKMKLRKSWSVWKYQSLRGRLLGMKTCKHKVNVSYMIPLAEVNVSQLTDFSLNSMNYLKQ